MSPNQKRAWGNIIVWGSFLVALAIALGTNGTIFFWQEDSLRNTFYAITGAAFAAWFIMMLVVWLTTPKSGTTTDERDNQIFSRANSLAGPIALTAVAATALVLGLIYTEDKNSVMSTYFLMYITIINIVVYWLAQAVGTLIGYRRS